MYHHLQLYKSIHHMRLMGQAGQQAAPISTLITHMFTSCASAIITAAWVFQITFYKPPCFFFTRWHMKGKQAKYIMHTLKEITQECSVYLTHCNTF